MTSYEIEIASGTRFEFGANWSRFLRLLDEGRIGHAEESLRSMLGVTDLSGVRFLDVGSGSGLFSLAARRLGASVHSFDYDPQSVACTQTLYQRYFAADASWCIEAGSVLDRSYLDQLGQFDVVYSWGVLHHTGAMWQALENVAGHVRDGGRLFIALYNDQGVVSRYWYAIKNLYARVPMLRWPLLLLHVPYPFLPSLIARAVTGRLGRERGMSLWYDLVDWIGGFPFEVARPAAVSDFYRARGFRLERMTTTRRSGCNQFVFVKDAHRGAAS